MARSNTETTRINVYGHSAQDAEYYSATTKMIKAQEKGHPITIDGTAFMTANGIRNRMDQSRHKRLTVCCEIHPASNRGQVAMKLEGSTYYGRLFINNAGDVLFYGKFGTLLSPICFGGTTAEYIQDQGDNMDDWTQVETKNPYGDYEENCSAHAQGMINMDRKY